MNTTVRMRITQALQSNERLNYGTTISISVGSSSGARELLTLALFVGDVLHVELADQVAEDDCAVAGYRGGYYVLCFLP